MIEDAELPHDPDWDAVPAELVQLSGMNRQVIVLDEEGVGPATLVVVPQLFAHARRLSEED